MSEACSKPPSLKLRVGRLPDAAPASMAAPVPYSLRPNGLLRIRSTSFFASSLTPSGSAISGGLLPLTATPFSLLEPIIAPIPLRPAAWFRSLTTHASLESLSPAGPMSAVLAWSSPTSSLILSWHSATSRPQRPEASLSSASPSLTHSQSGSSAAPLKTTASNPECFSSAPQ